MATADLSALATVAEELSCPECSRARHSTTETDSTVVADSALTLDVHSRALRCVRGHSFDIAKQGYVSLLTGASTKMTGDTPAMLDARAAFQQRHHFAPIATATTHAVTATATTAQPKLLEIGAGTGYYAANVLDAAPHAHGIAVDVAKPAARRCARAHPRMAAVLADAWIGLPVRTDAVTAVLAVFAPRNPREVARVLRADGRFVVVTPTDRHLGELIEPLGMVTVDPAKNSRLDAGMAGYFDLAERELVEYPMTLTHTDIADVVGMGPSAHHRDVDDDRVTAFPETMAVTASVLVSTYRPAARTRS